MYNNKIKYNILKYFDIKFIYEKLLNLNQNFFKWKHVSYKLENINFLYNKTTLYDNSYYNLYYKKQDSYLINKDNILINKILILLNKDNKKECKRILVYNIWMECIILKRKKDMIWLVKNYNLDITFFNNKILKISILNGDLDIIKELFNINYKILYMMINDEILNLICKSKKYEILKYFLENKICNIENSDYIAAIELACQNGSERIVKYFLENKLINLEENIDVKNYLLVIIGKSGNLILFKYYLDKYNINDINTLYNSLIQAINSNRYSLVKYILDLNKIDHQMIYNNHDIIKICCKLNNISVLGLLLEEDYVNPYIEDYLCFRIAVKKGNLTILQMLYEYNINFDLHFDDNHLLELAKLYKQEHIINYLLTHNN